MTHLTDERFQQSLAIAHTYLESHSGTMPPMIIGYTAEGEYLALLGTFRDFQEQLTFCSIARMGFILHNIAEYFVLTHGDMTDTTNGKKNELLKQEVVMAAGAAQGVRRGKVFRVDRHEGQIDSLSEEMEFDTDSGGIDGMFMNILPEKNAVLPEKIKANIEQVVAQIRYIAPERINEPHILTSRTPAEEVEEEPSAIKILLAH